MILIIGYVYLRMVKLVSCEVIDKRLVEERISRDGIVSDDTGLQKKIVNLDLLEL